MLTLKGLDGFTNYIVLHEQELLKKCSQCMDIIVCTKDRQAAEANKNASILLQQLDDEKVCMYNNNVVY